MGKKRIAINGFGRIGRVTARIAMSRNDVELVAVNDLADAETMAHLFKYDSVHRTFPGKVEADNGNICIDDQVIYTYAEKDPKDLPWADLGVDVVIEATGVFRTRDGASRHLEAGAPKVIISAPPKDNTVKTVVLGINDDVLDGDEKIISNASCTTNCAAPLVKIVDELCGIRTGYITTIHSYTGDQRLHDAPHSDLRRARAAACSIVPTTTGAAKAITKIFPNLHGKMGGCGIRVPVPDGSLTDISCTVENPTTVEKINRAFRNAASGEMSGILEYIDDPVVSTDIIGKSYSTVFDSLLTSVIDDMVKVVGWYDNEAGYSNRLVDLVVRWA